MSSFNLWYHPLYTDGIHDEARFPKYRYQMLLRRLEQSEQFNQITIRTPEPISRDSLLLAHDATYVDAFLEEKLDEKEMRRIGLTPWTPKMIERTLCLTGGAVEATMHAVEHDAYVFAVNLIQQFQRAGKIMDKLHVEIFATRQR